MGGRVSKFKTSVVQERCSSHDVLPPSHDVLLLCVLPPVSGSTYKRRCSVGASDPFVTCEIYRSLVTACHDLSVKQRETFLLPYWRKRNREWDRGRERIHAVNSDIIFSHWHTHLHPEEAWCSCCRVTLVPVKLNGRYAKGFLRYSQSTTSSQPAGTQTEGPRRHGGMCVWIG